MLPKTIASAGTGLLAGGLERAVGDNHIARSAGLDLLRDLGALDALDAVAAFFHDAAHAHGDVAGSSPA